MSNLCGRSLPRGLLALFMALAAASADALASRCLYVSSYHPEYVWNFGIEKGMDPLLEGKCEVRKFYLDTQRNTDPKFAEKKVLEAKALIEQYKPDVVIACDDPASKYLVMPYLRNAAVPVVFCGINWTIEPYGYPYANATGMIEVSPVKPLLTQALATIGKIKTATFIAADVLTQHKEFEQVSAIFEKEGIKLSPAFVKTFDEWKAAYVSAQKSDLIYVSNPAGVTGWNDAKAAEHALVHARKLSVTTYDQVMPYAMLGMVKIAEEQGEWAAKVALRVLAGASPKDIPVIANRRWNIYANLKLLDKARTRLSDPVLHKAVKR